MTTRIYVLAALALCAGCSSARIDPMEYDYYSSGYAAPDATEPVVDDINAQPATTDRSSESLASDSSPAPIEPQPASFVHKMQKGESLYGLSRQYLGSGRRWREIADLNGLSEADTRRIPVGREIRIPSR